MKQSFTKHNIPDRKLFHFSRHCPSPAILRFLIKTVIHKNIPGIISAITTALAEKETNVAHMQNSSKGEMAYTILDIDTLHDGIEDKLMSVDGIIRVRVIK